MAFPGRRLGCAVIAALAFWPVSVEAAPDTDFMRRLCTSLSSAVDTSAPGGQATFVASYRAGPDESEVPLALRSSAFSYDNALAIVALVACEESQRAKRIGNAFLNAIAADRNFSDGRTRNAYRAGASVPEQKALLPGFWDAQTNQWAEDAYQDGTATGNVAWVALALLTLHEVSGDGRYLAAAGAQLRWIDANARWPGGPGFTGGLDGFDQAQEKLTWASTEHNVDIAAAAQWYGRAAEDAAALAMAHAARRFVEASFLGDVNCFVLGTTPEGIRADAAHLALDTQLWPLLLPNAPAVWRSAMTCAEQRLGVEGGFDFDNDRDGLWVEGTSQAALVYRALGDRNRSRQLLDGLRQDISPSGWLLATRRDRLTTGLKIRPQSVTADFFYFRRPHLAATAWAILAAAGWNPFTGKRVD